MRFLLERLGIQGLFAYHVISTFMVQVFSLVLSIGSAAIVARWLGPEGKGALALAVLAPGILALFLSGGIGVANVYYTGARRYDLTTLTANSLVFSIIGSFLGFAIIVLLIVTGWLGSILPGVTNNAILLAMAGLPFTLLGSNLSTILQGRQKISIVNLANLGQSAILLLLTALFVMLLKMGLIGALLASVIGVIAYCLALAWLVWREGGRLALRWEPPVLRETLAFGMRGYVGNLLQFFNYRLDLFLVNFYLGLAGVGIYSVSVRLAEMLWYLPNAVGFVIFPKAAATKAAEMNKITPRIFKITLGLTALGAVILALLGRLLILIVYSDSFLDAYLPLLALLPGVVLLGAGKVLTNEIAGRGYPHYNSINAGLSLILTIILDLLLIPPYGVLGASMASSIAYTVIFLVAIAFYINVSRKGSEHGLQAQG